MKVQKFHGGHPNEKVTIRIQVESEREMQMLEAMFSNTYKMQEMINRYINFHSPQGTDLFTHDEVKAAADELYRAVITKL